jgi:hypothetical protein
VELAVTVESRRMLKGRLAIATVVIFNSSSCSVHPGIAACKKEGHRFSSYPSPRVQCQRHSRLWLCWRDGSQRAPLSHGRAGLGPASHRHWMVCARARGRESVVSALRWSTISCRVGGLVEPDSEGHGILGSSLPFESTRRCSSLSEIGMYSLCSGVNMW